MNKYIRVSKVIFAFLLMLATILPSVALPISEAYAVGALSVSLSASSQNVVSGTPVTLVAQVTDDGVFVGRPTFLARVFKVIASPFTYVGQTIASIFGKTGSIAIQPNSQLAQVPNPFSFTYSLTQNATTSAGIYRKSDDVLVRTLWSSEPKAGGQVHTSTWDGKDDLGNTAPGTASDYVAKILHHNVKYVWEGVIGNTSTNREGPYKHHSFFFINDMTVSGNDGYFVTGYNELGPVFNYFDTSDINIRKTFFYSNYKAAFTKIASVGNRTFSSNIGGFDPENRYIVGFTKPDFSNQTELEAGWDKDLPQSMITFTAGIPEPTQATCNGDQCGPSDSVWRSVLDYRGASTTGLEAQRDGKSLFASKASVDHIAVFDIEIKTDGTTSGARKQTFMVDDPHELASAPNGDLWVVSKRSTGDVIHKFANLASAPLGTSTPASSMTLSGFSNVKDIAVSPDGAILAVADSGTSQQVKLYSASSGVLLKTHGVLGGHSQTGASIRSDVFSFDGAFLAFEPNTAGQNYKLWVGDNGNYRAVKFSIGPTSPYQFTVADSVTYTPHSYAMAVDAANPTKVFNQWYEYSVDYSKPLCVNNGERYVCPDGNTDSGPWKFVRNWSKSFPEKVTASSSGFQPRTIVSINTPAGVRTYAQVDINGRYNEQAPGFGYTSVYELKSDGTTREVVPYWNTGGYFLPDGSILHNMVFSNPPTRVERLAIKGWTSNNDPIWQTMNNSATAEQEGTIVGIDSDDPGYTPQVGIPVPLLTSSTNDSNYDKLVVFRGTFYVTPNSTTPPLTNAWHLGAKKIGTSQWSWLASPPGAWVEQGHDQPITTLDYWNYGSGYIIDPKGTFDYGPKSWPIGGNNGYSSIDFGITALGRSIVYSYHGEFWGNGQANQKIHFHENGLFVGQFGRTLYPGTVSMPERAGNSFRTELIKGPDGKTYYYHNDESAHGGIHRWRIDNIDNIGVITANLGGAVTVVLPTTSITSPTGGTITIPVGQTSISIPISATAVDTDGTIAKVEFYNGGTKLGEDTQAPYTFQWNGVTQGSYTLTTKATDNAGNIGTSAPVSISVQPGVATSYKVEFFAGTTLLGEDLSTPYTLTWSPTTGVTSTVYPVTAKVTRSPDGTVANSSIVNITVNPSSTDDPTKGDFKIYRLSSTNAVLPVSFGADLVFDGATTTTNPAIYKNVLASVYTSTTSQPNFHYMRVRSIPGYQVTRGACSYTRGTTECPTPTSFSKLTCTDGWCTDQAGVSPNTVTKIAYKYSPGTPIVTLTANPTTISPGQSTTLSWSSTGTSKANPCTAYDGWTGKKAASGTQVITNISSTRKFRIVCANGVGYGESTVMVNVVVQTNQPPTVSLSYTGPSGSIYRGDTLPFTATASDSDGSVSKVELYVDDQLTSTDTSTPYNFSWTVPMTPYVGSHNFYAVAYDNLGERKQSSIVQGNISTLRESDPIITVSPTSATAPANITITVKNDYLPGEEAETGMAIQKLEFYRGSTKVGEDTSYPYSFTDSYVPGGNYAYKALLWASNDGGPVQSSPSNIVNVTVSGTTPPPDTSVSGLKGEYFNNITLTAPSVLTRIDDTVNFDWGMGSPAAGINTDQFSVRWTGKIIPRYSETYTFTTTSDDGIRLWVNGQQLVNAWFTQAPTPYDGQITLTAGQEYDIRVEYYEDYVGTTAKLEWQSASQAREVIPSSQFKTSPLARLTDDTLVAAVANATEPVVRGIAIASVVVLLGVGIALIVKKKH
jgi:hypothetical protein